MKAQLAGELRTLLERRVSHRLQLEREEHGGQQWLPKSSTTLAFCTFVQAGPNGLRIADLLDSVNAQSSVRVSERDLRQALNELVRKPA